MSNREFHTHSVTDVHLSSASFTLLCLLHFRLLLRCCAHLRPSHLLSGYEATSIRVHFCCPGFPLTVWLVVPPPLSRYQILPNLALKWLILGVREGFADPVLGLEQYLCWLTGNIASLVANYAECYFGLYPCHQLCPWYQVYGSFCFPI